ncbi:MAG: AAA family ATPase [Bacteroidota bacterium]
MKYLPIGRQSFKEIISEDLLYVDKTRQVYELIRRGKLYFFSRPRRFGKSLLISTFRHLFGGEKHLFKELYIGQNTDYNFDTFPVIQFNFAAFGHRVENLEEELSNHIHRFATQFEVEIEKTSLATQFRTLIEGISHKDKPVVLLVDEYDKPIVDFLTEPEKARSNQEILKQFFGPLKELEAQEHVRFLFITGVSKFSKVSLFSDLNNLTDLTIHPLAYDLLGITSEELLLYFDDHIQHASESLKMNHEEILHGIKLWYDGYSYDAETHLYNPFSILNFFDQYQFRNFWFATGTPTFLVNSIRNQGINPKELENKEVSNTFFDKFTLEELDMAGLLFQTGYLTIKKIITEGFDSYYVLDYPNSEVRRSMMHNLMEAFTYKSTSIVSNALIKMERGLKQGDISIFVEQLEVILADISYHLTPKNRQQNKQSAFEMWEGYFHTIIYLLTSYMGFRVATEITKHKGRLDLLAETEEFLYFMEFKLDEPAENAIAQIKDRAYTSAYLNSPKIIHLVGIGFSKEERNVESWETEIWKRE